MDIRDADRVRLEIRGGMGDEGIPYSTCTLLQSNEWNILGSPLLSYDVPFLPVHSPRKHVLLFKPRGIEGEPLSHGQMQQKMTRNMGD